MIRRIKFRGKTLDTGIWVYGDLQQDYERDVVVRAYIINSIGGHYFKYEVRVDTVGQFTGVYDSASYAIYEGDIVKDNLFGTGGYVVIYTDDDVGSCGCCYPEFVGIGFVAQYPNSKTRCSLSGSCSITGTIHDKEK